MLLVLSVSLGGASAAVEKGMPPQSFVDAFQLGAGEACAFAVELEISGKAGAMFFEDYILTTAPGARATLMNVDTGKTITVMLNGAFRIHPQPDGSEIVVASGQNLLFTDAFGVADGIPPFMLHMTGRAKFFSDFGLDENGEKVRPIAFELLESRKVRDLCAELAS